MKRIKELELEISDANFWNDQNKAKTIMSEFDDLKNTYKSWSNMSRHVQDLIDLKELAVNENDKNILEYIKENSKKLERELSAFETKTKLSDHHDKNNAIIAIHAGAGGTESCDWVQMLVRMYSRWAEDKGFTIEVVDS
ncbi:MAG: PCRF domain-containing protein, partial [Endomicrobium sp.]|nr:PCRF domain-containing protein [Endomicrobium sp.]